MIGFFWSNASDTFVDVIEGATKKNVHWMSEGGELQFYIFAASSPSVLYFKQAVLIGSAPLPPNYALGYH